MKKLVEKSLLQTLSKFTKKPPFPPCVGIIYQPKRPKKNMKIIKS